MDLGLPPPVADFTARFGRWVDENLPDEWRDIPPGGLGEDAYFDMRIGWGKRMHAGGWLAPGWPERYGGLGLGLEFEIGLIAVLVAAGAPEVMNSNGIGIFGPALVHYGTEEQKERWLPPLLAHEELWCQGFSEPGAGSDLRSLQTRAEPDGSGWRLTGQKVWTSNAERAHWCYVLARVPGSEITMFAVDMARPRVTVRPLRNLSGTSEFCEVFLDAVVVPDEDVVGPVGGGWQVANHALAHERSTFMAQRALPLTREFQRLTGLVAIANSEAVVTEAFVGAFVRTRVLESVVRRVQATVAGGEPLGALAAINKLFWSETHQAQLGLLVDAVGVKLVGADPKLDRWRQALLYARAETIYGGTSEIQRNIIAKTLGLPSDHAGSN